MLAILVLFISGIYGGCEAIPTTNINEDLGIVGGFEGNIEDFPYQASLEYNGHHFCGASIIHNSILISAAHCMAGRVAEKMFVRVGSSLRETGGDLVRVKHIESHPSFTRINLDYDVAVLWLEHPLKFGPGVQPLVLAEPYENLKAGTRVLVSGWGMMDPSVRLLAPRLKYAYLQVTDHKKCNDLHYIRITRNMLCVSAIGTDDSPCMGDSGGPLVVGNGGDSFSLVGIVSWGMGCSTLQRPVIFTNVASVRLWIHTKIQENPHLL